MYSALSPKASIETKHVVPPVFCTLRFVCVCSSGMKLLIIVSLILSAKLSLAKMSSMDRLLQPALTQQDDWFLYFDRIFSLSSLERVDKPCEFLCVTLCGNNDLQTFSGIWILLVQRPFNSQQHEWHFNSFHESLFYLPLYSSQSLP